MVENTAPLTPEPIRVYMANGADIILNFKTDKERYILSNDQFGNPIPVSVFLEATVTQGGESSGLNDHTKTVGEPVNDALVSVEMTSPDGQNVVGFLSPVGNGKYTISLTTTLTGNYDIKVIASDQVPSGGNNNSQYLITTEHSFYVSLYDEPTEFTGKLNIQLALNELNSIMSKYCPTSRNCTLDNTTKKNINNAISLLTTALSYFESDGNHLKTTKGLNFYANITSAVNLIYSYLSNPIYGKNIKSAMNYLFDGTYQITLILRDDAVIAIANGQCTLSNCNEALKSANTEIGKALLDSKQNNYVYIYNHFTNSWKFSANILGANLRKDGSGESDPINLPTQYALEQNFPNPFNPTTSIRFSMPESNYALLQIYDVLGNLIATLIDENLEAGYHSVDWNAGNLSSGIYMYRLTSGNFIAVKKLILMK